MMFEDLPSRKKRVLQEKCCCLGLLVIFIIMLIFGLSITKEGEENHHDENKKKYEDHIDLWNESGRQNFTDLNLKLGDAQFFSNTTVAYHPSAEDELPDYDHQFYSEQFNFTLSKSDYEVNELNESLSDFVLEAKMTVSIGDQDLEISGIPIINKRSSGDNQKMCRIQRHGSYDSTDHTCYVNNRLVSLCFILTQNVQDQTWAPAEGYEDFPCRDPSNDFAVMMRDENYRSSPKGIDDVKLDVYITVRSDQDPYVVAVQDENTDLGPTKGQLLILGLGMILVASVSIIVVFVFLCQRSAKVDEPKFTSLADVA